MIEVTQLDELKPTLDIDISGGESMQIPERVVRDIVRGTLPLDSPEAQLILRVVIADWYYGLINE